MKHQVIMLHFYISALKKMHSNWANPLQWLDAHTWSTHNNKIATYTIQWLKRNAVLLKQYGCV